MALLDRLGLRPAIQEYASAVHDVVPEVPYPPQAGSSILYYSHWFATIDFLIQTQSPAFREQVVQEWLRRPANNLGEQLAVGLNLPMVLLPQGVSLGAFGAWNRVQAAATSGDNWCQTSHGNQAHHLPIERLDSYELWAECNAPAPNTHESEYNADRHN